MSYIKKIIIYSFLFFFSNLPVNAHVDHYKDLNLLEYDLFRNKNHIGKHIFVFKREGENLIVKSEINFRIKKLGVVLYQYSATGTETYNKGKLIKFVSKTDQNGKKKYVNIDLENDEYIIDGSSYKGPAPQEFMIGTWWNHSIIKANAQISAVSGRIIKQNVKFVGKETVNINDKKYKALHFNFSSSDPKLSKDKKLNTDIWYDENNMYWIKAFFKKKGKWEYKLIKFQ